MIHLDEQINALEELDLGSLRASWASRYGTPPRLRSQSLLRLMLAWRLQADEQGGLPATTRRLLAKRSRAAREGLAPGEGTILRRDWQGRQIEVKVVSGGFEWEGEVYPSLSAIARGVTETRWNGPRFFGLRNEDI